MFIAFFDRVISSIGLFYFGYVVLNYAILQSHLFIFLFERFLTWNFQVSFVSHFYLQVLEIVQLFDL